MTSASAREEAASRFRVLIVEDEMMIALCIEQCLAAQGHAIVGPVGRVSEALHMAAAAPLFDFALLDINLAGEEIYPVATALKQSGIPFVFLSGYGASGLRPEWQDAAILEKPFSCEALKNVAEAARLHWRTGHCAQDASLT